MDHKSKGGELPLIDYPSSRNDAPVTSFLAVDRLAKSGEYQSQKQMALEALRTHDGATSAELAAYLGVDRHLTASRLCDLRRAGLVERGERRPCQRRGTSAVTWFVSPRSTQSKAAHP